MYFPYFRGRQNELIAIRELVDAKLLSDKIIPIVEPVKVSSTLVKTLTTFKNKHKKIVYIVNPAVGSYLRDLEVPKNNKIMSSIDEVISSNSRGLYQENPLILGMILESNLESMQNYREYYNGNHEWLAVCTEIDALHHYANVFVDEESGYNLIPDDASFRRRLQTNKIMLANRFKKLERNTDYEGVENIYSEDHLYYNSEGYFGFSDYSIVGDEYSETGFAPYAVAIHIVYFDKNKALRIKHFVSDSNNDINNPAGKFAEALEKLMKWKDENEKTTFLNTLAMRKFQELYEKESYPGLGSVKKFSIMHHLELMSKFLEGDIT